MIFINQCHKILSHILNVKWRPTIKLVVVILSWASVVGGMWLAFQYFTTERLALNFITFGPVTLFGLGGAVPSCGIA